MSETTGLDVKSGSELPFVIGEYVTIVTLAPASVSGRVLFATIGFVRVQRTISSGTGSPAKYRTIDVPRASISNVIREHEGTP